MFKCTFFILSKQYKNAWKHLKLVNPNRLLILTWITVLLIIVFPNLNISWCRYEAHICYGNKLVTAASGLLEQLILHCPKIKSLHSKGSDANFRFRPLGNLSDAKWFTKSTLIRYTQVIIYFF